MGNTPDITADILKSLSVLGALLLWAGFFLLGIIARRYEVVFKKWTGWKSLMTAPSGILVYVAVISAQILALPTSESVQKVLELLAYGALLISSLACLLVVQRFFRVLRQITNTPKEG